MSARRATRPGSPQGWIAFTVPPAAWMAQLLLLYLLVPVACRRGRFPLLAVTVVALVVALAAIATAGRRHRPGGDADATIGDVGRIQGGIFVLAILVTGAAGLWIDPCA